METWVETKWVETILKEWFLRLVDILDILQIKSFLHSQEPVHKPTANVCQVSGCRIIFQHQQLVRTDCSPCSGSKSFWFSNHSSNSLEAKCFCSIDSHRVQCAHFPFQWATHPQFSTKSRASRPRILRVLRHFRHLRHFLSTHLSSWGNHVPPPVMHHEKGPWWIHRKANRVQPLLPIQMISWEQPAANDGLFYALTVQSIETP